MTVYRVDLLKVGRTPDLCISSYRAPGETQKQEFFTTRERADARAAELRNSITTLLGYTEQFEVTVTPVEVKE